MKNTGSHEHFTTAVLDDSNYYLPYEDAIRIILDSLNPLPPVGADILGAHEKILAEPFHSRWDLPTADNSAMDGYAVACDGLAGGRLLPVIGTSSAGSPFRETVPPGSAVKIMTGGLLPQGCDTVIPLEDAELSAEGVLVLHAPKRGQHVRRRGEEIEKGQLLCDAGTILTPVEIAALTAAGAASLRVRPAPRVAVFSTGDELVEVGNIPGPGQIVNSNAPLLDCLLREEGCRVTHLGIAGDSREALDRILAGAAAADVIISTGGVSVGEHDLVREACTARGMKILFWKVKIKPGKPVVYGLLEGRPFFGLPGNPASVATTFELFVRPALRRLKGLLEVFHPHLRASLANDVKADGQRMRFLWGALRGEGGRYVFTPSTRQCSGQNRTMQAAQALLPVPAGGGPIPAGSEVEVLLLRPPPGLATWSEGPP